MKASDHTARQELEEIIAEAAWRGNQEFNWKSYRSWNEIKGSTRDRWRYVASVVVDVLNGESKMPDDDLRAGAFWERHNKLMQDPERAAQFDTELARIRAVDTQVNTDDTLRIALTKLADELTPDERAVAYDIRALLAAHPAPETRIDPERMTPHVEADPESPHGTRMVWTAPVSGTRREDVARADLVADTLAKAFEGPHCAAADLHGADCTTPGGCYYHDAARAVLAVLPAPPVVDEASIRERIAQDIEEATEPDEADIAPHLWVRGMNDAARIARGAARG